MKKQNIRHLKNIARTRLGVGQHDPFYFNYAEMLQIEIGTKVKFTYKTEMYTAYVTNRENGFGELGVRLVIDNSEEDEIDLSLHTTDSYGIWV